MKAWLLLALLPLAAVADPRVGPLLTITGDTHPAVWGGFETGPEPLAGRPVGDEPPSVRLALASEPGRDAFLQITNQVSGGYYGVTIAQPRPQDPFPTQLAFDYRADPTLKVNLIARVRHQDFEIGFTGPRSDTGKTVWLGQLAGIQADGEWHHVEVPLLRLIRRELLWSDLRLTDLAFENRHLGDYLLAGFGGNPVGCRLALDHVYLGRPGPAQARLTLRASAACDGYAVVVDTRPATVPPAKVTQSTALVTVGPLANGTHYVHARGRAGGVWGPAAHYRLEVDTRPPAVGAFDPANGARACPGQWRCRVADDGAGVAPKSLTVTVGGRALGVEDRAVQLDPVTGDLVVRPALADLQFRPGEKVTVAVTAADELGQALAQPATAAFVMAPELDRDPPEEPSFWLAGLDDNQLQAVPGDGTFERGLDDWRPFGSGGVMLDRTTETAAAGRYSLKILCTENASPFSVFVRRTPFDASRYRLLSFDYRAPERLRVDFLLRWEDRYYRIRFTDRDTDDSVLGEVPNVVQDDQWHHAEVNLYDLLVKRNPKATDFTVGLLLLTGGPWTDAPRRFPGNYAGITYFIDNFQLVPMLGADARLVWRGADLTGVVGAEVVTAAQASQLPPPDATKVGQRVSGDRVPLDALQQGLVHLWARLHDAQGNYSEPLTMRLMVDAGRPVVGGHEPADGARAAPAAITLELRDEVGAGLDPGSVRLNVAGRTWRIDHQVLFYDAVRGRLVWDGRRADQPVVFGDGQTVEVALEEARDLAGNRPASLPRWQFTMDYAADRRGPDVEVSSRTHAVYLFDGLEGQVTFWRPDPAGAPQLAVVADDRTPGGHVLRLTPAATPHACWLTLDRQYAASRFGLVAFDYRLPARADLALLVQAKDRQGEVQTRSLTLSGAGHPAPALGQPDPLVADGAWHQAILPLQALLATDPQFQVPYIIETLGFGGRGGGPPLEIDNLFIFRESSSRLGRVAWTAYDETGVTGYSWVLDQSPATVPEAKAMTTATEQSWSAVPPGLSYFHIRAVDGAGNWGPTTHFMLRTPGTAAPPAAAPPAAAAPPVVGGFE